MEEQLIRSNINRVKVQLLSTPTAAIIVPPWHRNLCQHQFIADLEICFKVLQQVADDPTLINTHDRFKSLVAKIHKTGKTGQRQAVQVQHRQDDRALNVTTRFPQDAAGTNGIGNDRPLFPG
jgi:hypothetical protein